MSWTASSVISFFVAPSSPPELPCRGIFTQPAHLHC
jgi:hypothetical protein